MGGSEKILWWSYFTFTECITFMRKYKYSVKWNVTCFLILHQRHIVKKLKNNQHSEIILINITIKKIIMISLHLTKM